MSFFLIGLLLLLSCQNSSDTKSNISHPVNRAQLQKQILHEGKFDYKQARKILMGEIHLEMKGGEPSIEDIYCVKKYTNRDITSRFKMGKNKIPDYKVINTEHVWPKSRFFSRKSKIKRGQKSYESRKREADLHILYPSSTFLNSERSSFKFGDVIDSDPETQNFPCSQAQLGPVSFEGKKLRDVFFEPPSKSKGNIARAMFYFSIRYDEPISFYEESFLRKWHKADPPDEMEKRRNNLIEKFQGNRNPFIDKPELVNMISDF